jgi:hypothetical protein
LPLDVRLRVTIAAGLVPPLLHLVSFSRLASWLGAGTAAGSLPGYRVDLDDVVLAAWVDRLLRRLPGLWRHTCLKRAAVLYNVLRSAGRPVELWIGVRRDGSLERSVGAHAWLVRDGVPYLEPKAELSVGHTPIARFPDNERRPA